MRDLHDDHARDMMLDLTGERRDVPQMGARVPAELAGGQIEVGRSSTHAGSGTAVLGFCRASGDRACLVPAGTPEPRADEETKP